MKATMGRFQKSWQLLLAFHHLLPGFHLCETVHAGSQRLAGTGTDEVTASPNETEDLHPAL